MLKFADDAKIFSEVYSLEKVANQQLDLDKFHKWSEDRQMLLSAQRCKCLHIHHKNTYAKYYIGCIEAINRSYEIELSLMNP